MIKRTFDLDAATFGLRLILPISSGSADLIRVKFGSLALFSQIRLGLNGMPFCVVQSRSTSDAKNAIGCEQKFAFDVGYLENRRFGLIRRCSGWPSGKFSRAKALWRKRGGYVALRWRAQIVLDKIKSCKYAVLCPWTKDKTFG